MRQNISKKRLSTEMLECNFKPKIIGFKYNNSGLPQKQIHKTEDLKLVEERCLEWNEKKKVNKISYETKNREKCSF